MRPREAESAGLPHVLIVGGGFAGLACAQGLRSARVRVTLLDRQNHHLFQPLLYQVATAGLSPSQIAAPIRGVLASQRSCTVLLGELERVDLARREATYRVEQGPARVLSFDWLVLACGATHSYFGHDAWARHAPGLKTLEDALEIRRRFLLAFELAEQEPDPKLRAALLTFVIVGAGPTGVEMAGAMMEIALKTMPRDFRAIDTRTARVVLVEAQDRVLAGGFEASLSARALGDLRAMGVDVRLRTRVVAIDDTGVTLRDSAGGQERITTCNVVWAAGVAASPVGRELGAALDNAGRVCVEPDLSIPGHPRVFVIGDQARVVDEKTNGVVPGMAPGAMQMGRFVATVIARETAASTNDASRPRPRFTYVDKGVMATIGRSRAVARVLGRGFGGFVAWVLWAGLHIVMLINFRARVLVLMDWIWSYVTFGRGSRLITRAGSAP